MNAKGKKSDCPLNCALEILGDKWTLLIIRDIALLGKKNFKEFMRAPEGISTSVLANRLQLLVTHGILKKSKNKDNKLIINYSLSESGHALLPVLTAFLEWGLKYFHDIEIPNSHLYTTEEKLQLMKEKVETEMRMQPMATIIN